MALERDRKKLLKKGLNVDYIGFALVAIGLGCLEVTLDRMRTEFGVKTYVPLIGDELHLVIAGAFERQD